jgi:regulator of protease activity HflC (stomatin/prohibitin superfamily)
MISIALLPFIIIGLVVFLAASIKVLLQYERAVVFTLGKFSYISGPGLIFVIPILQTYVRIDMRTMVEDVPPQDVISRDNVTVKVNAVLYYRVVDPSLAVIQVFNFRRATSELAQTTLRSVLGKHELDDMLSERDKLNRDIQEILDKQTDAWGIKVQNVEIKHIDLDETMIRAMAKQAEAERMRRAKIINAEGEFQAAQKLLDAGRMLAGDDAAMQLRYLSTLQDIGAGEGNTILLPLPTTLLDRFFNNKK